MKSFEFPTQGQAALEELDALLQLHERFDIHLVKPGPGVGFAQIMWMRAHEGVAALRRQFPRRNQVGPWPVPRVALSLTARWMFEGSVLARWVAQDPGPRCDRVEADAAAERRDVLQLFDMTVPPKYAAQLDAAVANAKRLPPVRQMAEMIGDPKAYSIYSALCEPMHWGWLWLAETLDDGPGGHWLPHLLTVPPSFRMILLATGSICGLDVKSTLAAIPSCVDDRGGAPPVAIT